jgi:hypothetical protein
MSKFQVGDRVEFTEHYQSTATIGDQGTVTAIEPQYGSLKDEYVVSVRMDNGAKTSAYAFRLKLVNDKTSEFRFRSDCGDYSIDSYQSFEDALAGFKEHSRGENEAEIVEIITHGKYKAVLKIEAV